MESDRLTRWLTIGANLGILVGILLLIAELDLNRDAIRAQTRHDLSMGIIDAMQPIVSDTHFAGVHRRGSAGEDLTPDEAWQLRFHYISLIRYWEDVHYQYRIGTYGQAEFERQLDRIASNVSGKFSSKIWCEYRSTISPDFRAQIESRLESTDC